MTLRAAAASADDASAKAFSLRDKNSGAADRHRARHDALLTDARAAGLDASAESLQLARASALEARTTAEQLAAALTKRCLGGVDSLAKALDNHARTDAELADVQAGADRACLDYAHEQAGYEERVRAIGGAAEQLERELSAAEEQRAVGARPVAGAAPAGDGRGGSRQASPRRRSTPARRRSRN